MIKLAISKMNYKKNLLFFSKVEDCLLNITKKVKHQFFLNSTINNVGLNVLAKFDTFSIKDFKNSRGIYLINTPITSISIQKNLELKLLDYFYVAENSNLALIEQNSIPDIFILILTLFVLGNIIGWSFIFSIIKQPYILKKTLANEYIILLVSVLNHGKLPTRFIFFTISLGIFLGRRLILFLSVPYPKSLFVIFFFPFLFFF